MWYLQKRVGERLFLGTLSVSKKAPVTKQAVDVKCVFRSSLSADF